MKMFSLNIKFSEHNSVWWSTAFWERSTCLLAWFITLDVFVLLQKPPRASGLNAPLHQFAVIKRTADSARRSSSTGLTVFTNLLHCVCRNCYTSNRLFHLNIRQLGCQICGPPDITQDTTTTGGFQFHTSQAWSRELSVFRPLPADFWDLLVTRLLLTSQQVTSWMSRATGPAPQRRARHSMPSPVYFCKLAWNTRTGKVSLRCDV